MKIVCVIPARLASSRFPRKMLSFLGGKPLLQRVFESALSMRCFSDVVIAVDSEEIQSLVESFGGKALMTPSSCNSGTERIAWLAHKEMIDGDVFVNWQGDEPFINKEMIGELCQSLGEDGVDIWTLKKRIENPDQVASLQYAKIVTNCCGEALFFSRSPIPCYRDGGDWQSQIYYKHVGIYAYTKRALLQILQFSPCEIEEAEKLEQLRFLYEGLKIRVHETVHEVQGIDLPEHLVAAEALFSGCKVNS